jgi:hypothetical protein
MRTQPSKRSHSGSAVVIMFALLCMMTILLAFVVDGYRMYRSSLQQKRQAENTSMVLLKAYNQMGPAFNQPVRVQNALNAALTSLGLTASVTSVSVGSGPPFGSAFSIPFDENGLSGTLNFGAATVSGSSVVTLSPITSATQRVLAVRLNLNGQLGGAIKPIFAQFLGYTALPPPTTTVTVVYSQDLADAGQYPFSIILS